MTLGKREVFTNLHHIERWQPLVLDLPLSASNHGWRADLERDLVADRFLTLMTEGGEAAVAAGMLNRADWNALIRFARDLLLRPLL